MWPKQFEKRLQAWAELRNHCASGDVISCLNYINDWWMSAPWRPYYLHWDDLAVWPDPWQLLLDNIYCDLARSLGIVYTIMMLDRAELGTVEIIETDLGNLVLVDSGKYILNWCAGTILNNPSTEIKIHRRLDSSKIAHLLG